MPVPLKDVLDALPPKRRAALDRRSRNWWTKWSPLKELRRLSAKSQVKIAKKLKISQPRSLQDREANGYVSLDTLRSYVRGRSAANSTVDRAPP